MGVRFGGIEVVERWIAEHCERFGEAPAWQLHSDFSAWLVASREMRQQMRISHKLSKGEFGEALAQLGFAKRLKNGRTYYLGIALKLPEL